MYKTIQRLIGHRIIRIGENGPCGYNNTESNVSVMLANGNWKDLPFGGFLEAGNIVGIQRIKVMDISALCSDEDGYDVVYTVPKHHYVVGTYLNGKCFLLLYDGKIKHVLDKRAAKNEKNNVVWLKT